MNVNEVIANRAIEIAGGDRFADKKPIHPQRSCQHGAEHERYVSHGDSTSRRRWGLIPSCCPVLTKCAETLGEKAEAFANVLKIGRTHLADATPLSLGQEFGGFARQLTLSVEACREGERRPAGTAGRRETAVGSGINTHPKFGPTVCQILAMETDIQFVDATDHFEANAQRDAAGRMPWGTPLHRLDPVQRRQQYPLARLRPAMRVPRDFPSRPATGQFHHAGQGESGVVRKPDAGCRAGNGERPRRSPSAAPPAGSFNSIS